MTTPTATPTATPMATPWWYDHLEEKTMTTPTATPTATPMATPMASRLGTPNTAPYPQYDSPPSGVFLLGSRII